MSDIILLVFEGERTERLIFNSLQKNFFSENKNKTIIHTAYGAEIYQLWKKLEDDSDLDLLEVLKERSDKNSEKLRDIERDQVSQIFLFFDYDGHAPNASDEKIEQMLNLFNEETDNGKLYISYPMSEAVKDLNNDISFKDNIVPAKENIRYKEMVGKNSKYNDMKKLDWNYVISENLKKANFIISNEFVEPKNISDFSQDLIFDKQIDNYIKPSSKVAVLSGFPFFIVEYFGIERFIIK